MTFNPNVQLDPGQVSDRRRVGGRGVAIGGTGALGLIIVVVYALLGGNPSDVSGLVTQGGLTSGPESSQLAVDCRTGADANARQDCRILGFVNSIQAYWTAEFERSNLTYEPSDTVLFTGSVGTACGSATSASGPFYCPADRLVYIDLGFYDDLERDFGARGGPLAEAYVLAHEYGHHVSDLLGVLRQDGSSGAGSTAVRIELQADCFAGVWAKNAEETGFLVQITPDQIAQALDAAAAVGDDRIQERMQGSVNPETWTHGSAEQRQEWFEAGYGAGSPAACDTFNTN